VSGYAAAHLIASMAPCAVVVPAAELSSAHAQAASLSEVAAAGEALRTELESELLDTQRQLSDLTLRLTDSNMVSSAWQLCMIGRCEGGQCCIAGDLVWLVLCGCACESC
jgi:hypothetical protein